MKKFALPAVLVLFLFSFLAETCFAYPAWVPLKDPRIELSMAGTAGGTSQTNSDKVQKVCTGKIKGTKREVVVVVNPKQAPIYLEVTYKLTKEYGSQEYGHREWRLTLKKLNSKDLTVIPKVKSTTGKMVQGWEYSDGSLIISGKIPEGGEFSASLVDANDPHPDRE